MENTKRWTRRPAGSNWGDFGVDDEVGRLNLITPEIRRAAVEEVRDGHCFMLSLPLDYPGGFSNPMREPPQLFSRGSDGEVYYNWEWGQLLVCDDAVVMWLQYSTQWDSLAHIGEKFDVDGSGSEVPVYYNGWRAHEHIVGPSDGEPPCARRLGIENMAVTGAQGRGVLFDFVRAFGTAKRPVGYDDLMKVIDDQRIEVRKGDFLLFYTGLADVVMEMRKEPDPAILSNMGAALDGRDERLLRWIDDSGVVALIADNGGLEYNDVETTLNPASDQFLPLHRLCLFKLGIHIGEFFWLSDLAAYMHKVERHAFLFTGPPLRLPGAVGSPVSAVATV